MKAKFPLRLLAMSLLLVAASAQAQFSLSNLWSIPAGGRSYVITNSTERGIAYYPPSNHVYLVSRTDVNGVISSTPRVVILNGDTGAEIGFLDTTGVASGTFLLSAIGVAEDGAIYIGNLSGGAAAIPTYRLYRWETITNAPVQVFTGNPGGTAFGRWGDNLAVRGAGTNTQVLIASDGVLASILSPTNETLTGFGATPLTVSGISAADMQKGVSWGTNNTFYAKATGGTRAVRYIQFNLAAGTASLLVNYVVNTAIAGIAADLNNQLLAGVFVTNNVNTAQQLIVYDVSVVGNVPSIGSLTFSNSAVGNPNLVGGVTVGSNRVYAIATHHGLIAAEIVVSSEPVPPKPFSNPASQTVVQGGYTTLSGSATGSRPLYFQWQFNGAPISGETNSSLNLTNVTPATAGGYRLIYSNTAGVSNSTTATITIQPTALSATANVLWRKGPDSLPFLANDNNQRGLAYSPSSGNLILASRTGSNALHVLDSATGNYVRTLNNNPAVINGGTIVLNQVVVADDGQIYAGNVTLNSATNPSITGFKLYRWIDDNLEAAPEVAWSGDPGFLSPGLSATNRWGDTMAVRGTGDDTQILLGSRNGTVVSILTPSFGQSSQPQVITSDAPAGSFGLGLAFGEGDTIWAKSSGAAFALRRLSFNLDTFTATTLAAISNYPNMANIGYDPANQLLVGVSQETPDNVRLFDALYPTTAFPNVDTEFFPTDNVNGNGSGAVAFAPGRIFALDSNNGIIALSVGNRLRKSVSGNDVIFTWSGGSILQSAPEVNGPWTDVMGAVSPHPVPLSTAARQFYRLRD